MTKITLTSDANAPWRRNREPRPPRQVDVCKYCGNEYHPMPVYVHKVTHEWIWVCHYKLVTDDVGNPIVNKDGSLQLETTACGDKAIADGYVYRPDLTPRR